MGKATQALALIRNRIRGRWFWALSALVGLPILLASTVLVLWTVPIFGSRALLAPYLRATRGLTYLHDSVREVPWSMHVIKINRSATGLYLDTSLGNGASFGMSTISEQVACLTNAPGQPIAAINGDLYNNDPDYAGDPEGLQIRSGELVSGPSSNRVCVWIDAGSVPHRGDVRSRFTARIQGGAPIPFALNQARAGDAAVLYTRAVGPSTRTRNGVDLLLESSGTGPWLPLAVGTIHEARVRTINRNGNTLLTPDIMVFSIGPELLRSIREPSPDDLITLSTATDPDLQGARTAIGGGPTLVAEGRTLAWPGVRLRHPRTALGWNQDYIFLVEVDGRQLGLSAGMTLPELADYMLKLGCLEAMNLDGGGSATCWLYGNVMNSPSQGRERPSANGVVVFKGPRQAP